jgi:hypothetical protein
MAGPTRDPAGGRRNRSGGIGNGESDAAVSEING